MNQYLANGWKPIVELCVNRDNDRKTFYLKPVWKPKDEPVSEPKGDHLNGGRQELEQCFSNTAMSQPTVLSRQYETHGIAYYSEKINS